VGGVQKGLVSCGVEADIGVKVVVWVLTRQEAGHMEALFEDWWGCPIGLTASPACGIVQQQCT